MKLSVGIVGLPNVGKSTLFNTLTNIQVPAENYPFCTIDSNVGVVAVPDARLGILSEIAGSEELIPAAIEFHDIAGLVRGAHKGEGLGNEFLGQIRNTQIIMHIMRDFDSTDIVHVENTVDPKRDKGIIEAELILKDIDTIEAQIQKYSREVRKEKDKQVILDFLKELNTHLEGEKLACTFEGKDDDDVMQYRRELNLLTDKQIIYVLNVNEESYKSIDIDSLMKKIGLGENEVPLPLNIKLESEVSLLDKDEQVEYRNELGMDKSSGLNKLIRKAYDTLDLQSFFTVGEKETRAWTIKKGDGILDAAGTIHTDFATNFIVAEVISYSDFIENNGWAGVKDAGKLRLEGKGYVMQDGDIVNIRHGAH